MQITLTLNKDKEVIWSLPQTKTYLTIEVPSVTFNVDELSNIQKIAIVAGLRNKKVLSDTKPEELIPLKPQVVGVVIPSQPQVIVAPVQDNQAKELLQKNVSEVKKTVLTIKDLRLLRLLVKYEEVGSKRVTILKAIREQIDYLVSQVTKSIETEHEATTLPDPAMIRRGSVLINYDVVESDPVPITLKIEKHSS